MDVKNHVEEHVESCSAILLEEQDKSCLIDPMIEDDEFCLTGPTGRSKRYAKKERD